MHNLCRAVPLLAPWTTATPTLLSRRHRLSHLRCRGANLYPGSITSLTVKPRLITRIVILRPAKTKAVVYRAPSVMTCTMNNRCAWESCLGPRRLKLASFPRLGVVKTRKNKSSYAVFLSISLLEGNRRQIKIMARLTMKCKVSPSLRHLTLKESKCPNSRWTGIVAHKNASRTQTKCKSIDLW